MTGGAEQSRGTTIDRNNRRIVLPQMRFAVVHERNKRNPPRADLQYLQEGQFFRVSVAKDAR